MSIKISSEDKNAIWKVAEAVVDADLDETIIVDTEFLRDLALQKADQIHRVDLTIRVRE